MVRQIFKDRVIAVAGPLPGQLTNQNLSRWIQIRKGRFSGHFDEHVTHLLCTEEQFKKKTPQIRAALQQDKKNRREKTGRVIHIVHCDWFEFSAVKEKRLPEREFSMTSFAAKRNAVKREAARIERGILEGERGVNTNLFHIYHDREFFPYQINITRDDESMGEIGQRFTLSLWESNAKPHLYWFVAKFFKKKGARPLYERPSPCSDKWRPQMDLFMEFFRKKTGVEWEDRVMRENTMSSAYFVYSPPTRGKPIGRRLRHSHEYCLEINSRLRGLPWPPILQAPTPPAEESEESIVIEAPGTDDGASVAMARKGVDEVLQMPDWDNENADDADHASDGEDVLDLAGGIVWVGDAAHFESPVSTPPALTGNDDDCLMGHEIQDLAD